MKINVSSDELHDYTKKLKALGKNTFPKAVRSTLNDSAFDVKKNTLQISIKDNFPHLKAPQFFKKQSGVQKAATTDIRTMRAVVGLLEIGNPAARRAIDEMDKQEKGGVIRGGLAYLKSARGERINGFVRRENYYDKDKVISGRSKIGRNKGTNKSKFVARAYRAHKDKKPMFINSMKGDFLARVTSFRKTKKKGLQIKMKLLLKRRTSVKIKPTHFMQDSADLTKQKINTLYIKNANYWLNKVK